MNPIDHNALAEYSIDDVLEAVSLLARSRPTDARLERERIAGIQALQDHLALRAEDLAAYVVQEVIDDYADVGVSA